MATARASAASAVSSPAPGSRVRTIIWTWPLSACPAPTTVFLISDFQFDEDSDPAFASDARRFSREHDLVAIRLHDPGAESLPDVGMLALADPETGRRRLVDTSDARVRDEYSARRSAQRDAIEAQFMQLRSDMIHVSSAEDYVPALIGFFRRRDRVTR